MHLPRPITGQRLLQTSKVDLISFQRQSRHGVWSRGVFNFGQTTGLRTLGQRAQSSTVIVTLSNEFGNVLASLASCIFVKIWQ